MSSQASKVAYPRSTDIRRILRVAQSSGLIIGSVEIGADGSIRVGTDRLPPPANSEFDRLEAAGLL